MARLSEIDAGRRQFLLYALASGFLAGLTACGGGAVRGIGGPGQMPANRSIFEYAGDLSVNNVPATLETFVHPGDVIRTAAQSYVIFVVDEDAFVLLSDSEMQISGGSAPEPGYSLNRGKARGALASRSSSIRTSTAFVGIRGIGIYVESDPGISYVCTCYGVTDIAAAANSGVVETIEAEHHDAPRYVIDDGGSQRIEPAPFKNHDDQELLLIETLAGRFTPYVVPRRLSRSRTGY